MRHTDSMTVGELMLRDVVVAREGDGVEKVYAAMIEGRFRHMPVVAEDRTLLGIVSDRDLRNVLVFINEPDGSKGVVGNKKLTVAKVMTREPLAADADDSVKTAVRLMIRHKVGCLPVCDDKGRLIGIVTETDMLKLLEELLTAPKK